MCQMSLIKQYRRSKTRFFLTQKRGTYLLLVLAVAFTLLGSFKAVYPAKKEGKWEDVRDFSGTLTIKRNADFAGTPIANTFKIKVKDDSLAVIQVTGTDQDGRIPMLSEPKEDASRQKLLFSAHTVPV